MKKLLKKKRKRKYKILRYYDYTLRKRKVGVRISIRRLIGAFDK